MHALKEGVGRGGAEIQERTREDRVCMFVRTHAFGVLGRITARMNRLMRIWIS